jgi:hypothetical protein
MTTDLRKEFVKKWIKDWCYMDADGKEMPGSVWSFISKALTSEYKRGYKDGILMGHFEEAEDKTWYVKQAEKRGYKRGREEEGRRIIKIVKGMSAYEGFIVTTKERLLSTLKPKKK